MQNPSAPVVGDAMPDRYWNGAVERISPEAPVPVLRVTWRHDRAGGAANLALNLAASGASVTLLAPVGEDEAVAVPIDGGVAHEPARVREVFDVSGAGDTTMPALARRLAQGDPAASALRWVHAAAGLAVQQFGTAVGGRDAVVAAMASSGCRRAQG